MCGAEGVIIALGALGEAGQTAAAAQRPDTITTAGDDLVRIGLMADIPDQSVAWRVEHVVDGRCQFDNAKASAQMSAGYGNRGNGFLSQLIRELAQLLRLELAQLFGSIDSVEKRRAGLCHVD